MGRQTVCGFVRVFASCEAAQPKILQEVNDAVRGLRGHLDHIVLAVWVNPHQVGADCGSTAAILEGVYRKDAFVTVLETGGDLFVGAFNRQLPWLREHYDYMLSLSATSYHLISLPLMEVVNDLMEAMVPAIGVVQPENPMIREGAISNTCAFWQLQSLCAVGGFDNIDARPSDFRYDVHHQGVGELAVLFSLKRLSGTKPLVLVDSRDAAVDLRTAVGDPLQLEKIRHKERRIQLVLGMLGKTIVDLQNTIRRVVTI